MKIGNNIKYKSLYYFIFNMNCKYRYYQEDADKEIYEELLINNILINNILIIYLLF